MRLRPLWRQGRRSGRSGPWLGAALLAALVCGGCLGAPKPPGALLLSVTGEGGALGAVAVIDGRQLVTLADGRALVKGLTQGTHRLWLGAAHYRSRSETVNVTADTQLTLSLVPLATSDRAVTIAAPAQAVAGGRFDVDLAFNGAQSAQGVALRLRYAPAGVRYLGAANGGLWGAAGDLFVHAGADALGPYVAIAAGGAGGNYTGSGTIVTLTFELDGAGAVGFWLDPGRAEVRAATGQRQEAEYDFGGGLTVVN